MSDENRLLNILWKMMIWVCFSSTHHSHYKFINAEKRRIISGSNVRRCNKSQFPVFNMFVMFENSASSGLWIFKHIAVQFGFLEECDAINHSTSWMFKLLAVIYSPRKSQITFAFLQLSAALFYAVTLLTLRRWKMCNRKQILTTFFIPTMCSRRVVWEV